MAARTFINQEGTSNKFWTIEVDGASHTVHYGRLGTDGQVKTKTFADGVKATASAEKLIAEKLRKGYAEQAAATPPPAASPQVAVTAPPVAAPAPPADAAPLRSGVELRPDEWAWATWRPLPDPPGPPEPFDRARAAAIIKAAKAPQWGFWSWPEVPFTGPLTPEEASAWLRYTSEHRMTPTQSARAMGADPGVVPSTPEARRLASWTHLPLGFALAALIAISGPEDVAEWLLADRLDQQYRYGDPRDTLALGVRAHLLPCLSAADRERFVDAVRSRFARFSGWVPGPNGYSAPVQVLMAAQVGMHAELQALLDTWPDDALSGGESIDHSARPQAIAFGLGSADAVREAFERLRIRIACGWHVAGWLAHTETSGLALAADRIADVTNREDAEDALRVLERVHDPAAAPAMLELMRKSRASALARTWLSDHPREAGVGLARGLEGRTRPEAVDYLRARKRAGDDLAAALPHLSEGAAARLRDLVLDHTEPASRVLTPDEVPAELRAAPKKQLPAWLDVASLPAVIVGDGRLGTEDAAALLRLLASGASAPAGLDETDAFGWGLFEAWLAEGAPTKDKWALLALGELGGDASAVKLAPLIRAWPGESQHQRAVLGLGVLGQIGTDTALMQLSGIAEKVKFKALQQRAREAMDEIAAAKGMSKAELEDRIVPACGLDAQGSRTFDFGPRQFEFVLGPGMKPMVRDESGKVRSAPPKPGARDDAALGARAVEEWKLLRKQVGDVAKIQAARLEQAMVTQRGWSVADFERFVVNHPLQRHLARLLVWRDEATTFRVTDELDYADADDEPVTLTGAVRIVHPLQLTDDERAAWGEQLADYEIVPPFAQLSRPVLDIEPQDRGERELKRFKQHKIAAATLVRVLDNLGWHRGPPQDGGLYYLHAKPFPSLGVTAVVEYDGVPIGGVVDWDDQSIERCYVLDVALSSPDGLGYGFHERWRGFVGDQLVWGDVDPIVRSEVLADVAAVLEKAR